MAKPKPNPKAFSEAHLQDALHKAIMENVPEDVMPETVPSPEIIRALGTLAASFAVQSGVDRDAFADCMKDYYDGILAALGVPAVEEPKGPTLVLP